MALAIRDPARVDHDTITQSVKQQNMIIPAIGTGQAWGEEGLSFTHRDPAIRKKPSIEESIRSCADRIFHFHVADSNRWYPGAGHLDFQSILDVLFTIGYSGFVSGEFMPDPEANISAQRAVAYLHGLRL